MAKGKIDRIMGDTRSRSARQHGISGICIVNDEACVASSIFRLWPSFQGGF